MENKELSELSEACKRRVDMDIFMTLDPIGWREIQARKRKQWQRKVFLGACGAIVIATLLILYFLV